jgi:hypothetical protein
MLFSTHRAEMGSWLYIYHGKLGCTGGIPRENLPWFSLYLRFASVCVFLFLFHEERETYSMISMLKMCLTEVFCLISRDIYLHKKRNKSINAMLPAV